jgi:hypothetical protein
VDVIDKQAGLIEAQRRALSEAHFLLCWTYQGGIEEMPAGVCPLRVWHLDPSVVDNMNAGERDLYVALMALKPDD